jgi:PncC family amidohydrolase
MTLVKQQNRGYNNGMQNLMKQVHTRLIRRGKTLAVAESCTGGLVSSMLTGLAGSSSFFLLGTVAYSNQAKHSVLKVPSSLLIRHGAVSSQVAVAMCQAVRRLVKADYGIGITGIAGPAGGTADKPVGTVYIAVAAAKNRICRRYNFHGSRSRIRRQASLSALKMLNKLLGTLPKVPPLTNITHS